MPTKSATRIRGPNLRPNLPTRANRATEANLLPTSKPDQIYQICPLAGAKWGKIASQTPNLLTKYQFYTPNLLRFALKSHQIRTDKLKSHAKHENHARGVDFRQHPYSLYGGVCAGAAKSRRQPPLFRPPLFVPRKRTGPDTLRCRFCAGESICRAGVLLPHATCDTNAASADRRTTTEEYPFMLKALFFRAA